MAAPIDKATIVIQDWPGLQTNTGPMAGTDPGTATELVNLRVNVTGELASRTGIRQVQFDKEN